jgi:hypothetical protein
MVFNKSQAESQITELGLPVLSLMIKISKWEDKENYTNHIDDINCWLFGIQKILIRSKNKRFKSERYFKFLFQEQIESVINITHYINRDLRRHKDLNEINSDIEIFEKLTKIYKQLSIDLSNNEFDGIENYL